MVLRKPTLPRPEPERPAAGQITISEGSSKAEGKESALNMRQTGKNWTPSAILLAAAGTSLVLMGLYFLLLRPPLLPEDIRFMALSDAQLASVRPQLDAWLSHVFQVLGGYVLATGVLTITLAATAYRAHHRGAGIGALIGGAASIGLMAVVNFAIGSDFKWVLLGMALIWALSLAEFWLEENRKAV
jgi:hypothetical protein